MDNCFYDLEKANLRERVFKKDSSESPIHRLFLEDISMSLFESSCPRILDIGTGNGYVLREIQKIQGNKSPIYFGVDRSKAMIEKGKKDRGPSFFILGDNYELPFADGTFDLIVAKNVTRFSTEEVYRVLKREKKIIFREYGRGKGLVEIADFFKDRIIRSKDPQEYVRSMEKAGFRDLELRQIYSQKQYSIDEILKIIKSFPFIENFYKEDETELKENFFKENREIDFTSDQILITGRK